MKDDHKADLTHAEWRIMKLVWSLKPCAARDVAKAAKEQYGWSVSTVKTLLRRLVDKNQLKTTQVGNSFLYRPVNSPVRSLRKAADQILDYAIEGTVGPVVAYLVQKGNLSSEELNQLREVLDQYDENGKE